MNMNQEEIKCKRTNCKLFDAHKKYNCEMEDQRILCAKNNNYPLSKYYYED